MVDWSYGVLFVQIYRVLADITGIVTEQCAWTTFSELSSLALCGSRHYRVLDTWRHTFTRIPSHHKRSATYCQHNPCRKICFYTMKYNIWRFTRLISYHDEKQLSNSHIGSLINKVLNISTTLQKSYLRLMTRILSTSSFFPFMRSIRPGAWLVAFNGAEEPPESPLPILRWRAIK